MNPKLPKDIYSAAAFALLVIIVAGCAEKQPTTYYVHIPEDREMERHLAAAKEALDDFEVELAKVSLDKGKERLQYMIMAGFSKRQTGEYTKKYNALNLRLAEIEKAGVPIRVEFAVGYDPEAMEDYPDALKLGDLRKEMLSVPYHRRVEISHLVLYYTKGPGRKQYKIYLKRLAKYKSHILRVLKTNGLPEELICVAMIESAADPTRVSHAGAAGLWQFMPGTARKYGLIVNDSVDQRFDPVIETYAAARYFKDLLKMFDNDVPAALASYNCGEGFISQVLADPQLRNIWQAPYHGKDDQSTLPSIPRETYDYIVRWYAAAVIYQNMKEYGFEFPTTPDDPFILVHMTGDTDCRQLADDVGITFETLVGLNPSLKIGHIPEGQRTAVRLPPASSDDYAEKLREARSYRISYVYRHKVTVYQTLRAVSDAYGVSALRIADVNDLGQQNRLEPGTVIRIPTTAGNKKAREAAKTNVQYWRSQKGTLWDKKTK